MTKKINYNNFRCGRCTPGDRTALREGRARPPVDRTSSKNTVELISLNNPNPTEV